MFPNEILGKTGLLVRWTSAGRNWRLTATAFPKARLRTPGLEDAVRVWVCWGRKVPESEKLLGRRHPARASWEVTRYNTVWKALRSTAVQETGDLPRPFIPASEVWQRGQTVLCGTLWASRVSGGRGVISTDTHQEPEVPSEHLQHVL